MSRHTSKSVLADLPNTLPLFFSLFFSYQLTRSYLRQALTKKKSFNYDLIVINYSFTLAMWITTLFEYSNSDAKTWWGDRFIP
ncbi:hypothetical protein [Legionella sp. km772]|uniref:hypothetical protein n=1 Tax=Legionella sp. km772 TaxID=2498111 RepID=UPI000F8C9223|nr:hypothetical protein [Legionella sp. km772]RUR13122.1 hypothetical protein ELY15_03210 [Legionella sp. km772]